MSSPAAGALNRCSISLRPCSRCFSSAISRGIVAIPGSNQWYTTELAATTGLLPERRAEHKNENLLAPAKFSCQSGWAGGRIIAPYQEHYTKESACAFKQSCGVWF